MTLIIQAIDRHIGVQYTGSVNIATRKVILGRLNTTRAFSNGGMTVTFEPLMPKDKIIMITKVIDDTHERLYESTSYFRGFITTET